VPQAQRVDLAYDVPDVVGDASCGDQAISLGLGYHALATEAFVRPLSGCELAGRRRPARRERVPTTADHNGVRGPLRMHWLPVAHGGYGVRRCLGNRCAVRDDAFEPFGHIGRPAVRFDDPREGGWGRKAGAPAIAANNAREPTPITQEIERIAEWWVAMWGGDPYGAGLPTRDLLADRVSSSDIASLPT
jgi:hypothetical protein